MQFVIHIPARIYINIIRIRCCCCYFLGGQRETTTKESDRCVDLLYHVGHVCYYGIFFSRGESSGGSARDLPIFFFFFADRWLRNCYVEKVRYIGDILIRLRISRVYSCARIYMLYEKENPWVLRVRIARDEINISPCLSRLYFILRKRETLLRQL